MFTLNCRGRLLTIGQPIVMGILNITPDSFYGGSRQQTPANVLQTAESMLRQGAMILDVGGQSTRPGSTAVDMRVEIARVVPAIEAITRHFPESFISVDTYHAATAKAAVEAGACIVNDIGGGSFDKDMFSTVAQLGTPYICMHVKGSPATMHTSPGYADVTAQVLDYFVHKTAACLEAGITDLVIDPGFGFSKNSEHNFKLLANLEAFRIFGKPVLLGISRKSTIYKTLGITPEEALNGTTVLNTVGLLKGASILRVHDVKEAAEAIRLVAHLN